MPMDGYASPQAATSRSGGFRCRPDSAGASVLVGVWLVELSDLPDEVGELAGEREHDHVGGFAALHTEPLPLAVRALLAAPADLARAGVLPRWRRSSREAIAGACR